MIDLPNIPPSTKGLETNYKFYTKLSINNNTIASKKQIHLPNHNATCFKYHQKGKGKDVCRFNIP